tara:strand:+ start:2395 stop:2712 length:318 start_codon:yes stop_codon:yes gene_type:complete
MAEENLAEEIIRAFLLGVARGASEEALPRLEKHGKQVGKRIVRGRSKGGGPQRVIKRKVSAYQKQYGKNFQKVAPKYKTKSGSWKKDGFKRAQKEAHRLTKKEMK